MPFYDYECARCHATVELLHGIDDETRRTHDGCGGALERRFSATSVHFRGTGWAKLERRGGESASSSGSTAGGSASASASAESSPGTGSAPAKTPGGAGE
jgi:putative FmdB family regulatory protein